MSRSVRCVCIHSQICCTPHFSALGLHPPLSSSSRRIGLLRGNGVNAKTKSDSRIAASNFFHSSLYFYHSMRSSLVIAILILCGLTPPSYATVRSNNDGEVLLLDRRRHHRGVRVAADVPQPVLIDEFSRTLSMGDLLIPRYVCFLKPFPSRK